MGIRLGKWRDVGPPSRPGKYTVPGFDNLAGRLELDAMLSNPRWTVSAAALAGALGCGAGRPTAAPVPPPSPPVVQSLAGW